jgi:addiction module RelE/StbE family toxin
VRELGITPRFKRAFKKLIGKNPSFESEIIAVLRELSIDPFQAALETHKLKGALAGTWACSVGYDLRIVFEFIENKPEDNISLIDIGTHDEVY